ncbi:FAD-binding oxidoreductase [Methylomonas paludis]|uniref:FAD-binding oxidoreductase n=1 Tax=Methylomonas paludis TaxID=1173101 RepID=A0A975R9C9_9GAMM|nr:FAD-binding oxidoreductase [Methylomonas paludis]QWF70143.1 FAD-binding oxidoreductase [Methylomonas paludis]
MQIDVLIVGQGLAGSLLAWELIRQQCRVLVLDNAQLNSSQVAAGLINPVTGKRLLKAADMEILLPAAKLCYQQLSQAFAQAFLIEMPMLRILQNPNQQTYALQRLQQQEYQPYLQAWQPAVDGIVAEFGVLPQTQTGYLRTQALLTALRTFFIAQGCYRQVQLDYQDISLQPYLQWQDIQSRHIVFCEGHQALANPWFGGLPFQLAKGEILSCHTPDQYARLILNYGHWFLPLPDGHFKTGATFSYGNTDTLPSQAAQDKLLSDLQQVCPQLKPVSITSHQAGIRPTTLDKQAFVGSHPYYKNLHIFNGFGAKGSLSIPWHALQLIAALTNQQPLPKTSDIQRYYATSFTA